MKQHCYNGPAGVVFTPDELLIIWAHLTRIADTENKPIREKLERHLEGRELAITRTTGNMGKPSTNAN